jgi:dTDP-4-dehydrorhamnose reductase
MGIPLEHAVTTVADIKPEHLERLIERETANMVVTCRALGNMDRARKHWLALRELVKQRTPETVARMEAEKGLA